MSRFWEDLDLVEPGGYVPTMVQTLLTHLHLEDAPRSKQEAAIREWLKSHPAEPGSMMEYSLRHKGFGHLLEQPTTA